MYSAVAARSREIATLRALGFGGGAVIVAAVIGALLLALAGGGIGGGLAYLAFNNFHTSTMNWQSFSQITFAFRVTVVVGDNRMEVEKEEVRIPTTDHLECIARNCGFATVERFDLSVTTENLVHIKNAITENIVLRLQRPA